MKAVKFRARFATAGRLAPIENWLNLNIKGQWSIKMDSVSDDMSKKNYLVLFDNEIDRDSFTRRFTQGKAAYERKPQKIRQGAIGKIKGLFGKLRA